MHVLLIEDQRMFREGLALLIQPLIAPDGIREADSCEQALAMMEADGPADLALIDINLPGMSGVEGIALMRERWPEMPLVALSSANERDTVLAALDAGAMGFVPKSSSSQVLLAAVRLILAGGIYLPPSIFLATRPPGSLPPAAPQATASSELPMLRSPEELGLTPRQCEVLHQILQGRSAKEIARRLALSLSTVKAHTSTVLRVLKVTTRTQAVVAAGRLGLRFPSIAPESQDRRD